MSSIFFLETVSLVVSSVLAVLFSYSPFSLYDLQIMAVLFIIYFFVRKNMVNHPLLIIVEANIFVFILVSLVFSNGGIGSPFFFLLYFLLFACALILDSAVSLILTLVLVLLFIFTASTSTQIKDLLPVFSLPLIAPFAKYLGDLQKKNYYHKQALSALEKAHKKSVQAKQYNQEQTLIFLTTVLHRRLDEVKDKLENFMGDTDLDFLKAKVTQIEETMEQFEEYIEKI